MGDLEESGMLKMDFLALTTLTIIDDCLRNLKEKTGQSVDWSKVKFDDEKTLGLFGEGRTDAVFQFESGGMQEICRKLKPKNLEDLARMFNPIIQGWINYYGRYYKSALYPTLRELDRRLVRWATRKYKRLRRHRRRAEHWLHRIAKRQPALFAHWRVLHASAGR